jgi:superfamily II DNA/RNA helicase
VYHRQDNQNRTNQSAGSRNGSGNNNQSRSHSGFGRRFHQGNRPKRPVKELDIHHFMRKLKSETSQAPETTYVQKNTFTDFGLDQRLLNNIQQLGYTDPTPIQDQAIPLLLEGRDVIGLANTGTGKTAAFALPLINKILFDRTQKAIILTPTRELAVQIKENLDLLTRGMNISTIICIGGTSLHQQSRQIKTPFNFLVGTPGRVIDLMQRRWLYLDRFQNVVLDEADRMVDMGFINDMKKIFAELPRVRHTMFFTATMQKEISALVEQFLKNPQTVSVKTRDTAQNVQQEIITVGRDVQKIDILTGLLNQPGFEKILIFGRTKHGVEKITRQLRQNGFKADSIHSNKSQNYRLRALQDFKKGQINILCATDIAARGLDIDAISHVVNFDLPATYDDYVHRIGRTGRADKKGMAVSLVNAAG